MLLTNGIWLQQNNGIQNAKRAACLRLGRETSAFRFGLPPPVAHLPAKAVHDKRGEEEADRNSDGHLNHAETDDQTVRVRVSVRACFSHG